MISSRFRTRGNRAVLGLLRAAWVEYERDRARYLAVAMVYYVLVSLVPLLLLLLAGLGLLLRFSESAAEAERYVLLRLDATFGSELHGTMEGLLDSLQQKSVGMTLISVAGLLITASVLFRHLRLSFRAVWKKDPPLVSGRVLTVIRTTLLESMFSFVMVLGGGALLVAALVLTAVSQWIGRTVGAVPLVGLTVEWVLPILTSLILTTAIFAALLKFLPPVKLRWSDVWYAGLLCALAWMLGGEVLALYGVRVGVSPSASGALGALLAFMLWMNVVSQALFFGAELCKVAAARRQ
jgi:membrane protein